jgi:hypothetical protein
MTQGSGNKASVHFVLRHLEKDFSHNQARLLPMLLQTRIYSNCEEHNPKVTAFSMLSTGRTPPKTVAGIPSAPVLFFSRHDRFHLNG